VNSEVEVEVSSTVPFETLYYDLTGRGDLLISRKVSLKSPSDKLTFRMLVHNNAAPRATLVVYIIHKNEVIADSIDFSVGGALENFLNITMTRTQAEPGSEVDIVVGSRPNSLIGLRGIDQSVLILKKDKDIDLNYAEQELDAWNNKDGSTQDYRFKRSLFAPSGGSTTSEVFDVSVK
jgi:hypothetical protein